MIDSSLSPWARTLSSFISKYGEFKTAAACYALLLVMLILSCMFYYVATVTLVDVLAVMFYRSGIADFNHCTA